MKVTPSPTFSVVVLLLGCFLTAAPSRADIDVDFGASISLGDDADLYFHISSRYFDRDRVFVERYAAHYADPDDLAVSLYLSRCSGEPPDYIFSMRHAGISWWEISVRLGLPMDVWFVEVRRDPGPPYGRAYGHWKRHKRDRTRSVVLSDADIRNLVAVRMIHDYYGVPVDVAMEWRSSGRDLRAIMSGEYHKRHHKSASWAGHAEHPHGKGKGRRRGQRR